jgi:hypothetical protein
MMNKSAPLEVDCLKLLNGVVHSQDGRILLGGFGGSELADGL